MFNAPSEHERVDYTVDEPETPRFLEADYEVPRGGDEELLEMVEAWTSRSANTIAVQYNDRGEKLLESFLERHAADLPDGGNKLQQYIYALDQFGQKFAENGGELGSQNRMQRLLKNQVAPIVRDVMRAETRRQQAHGKRDFIPGRATEELTILQKTEYVKKVAEINWEASHQGSTSKLVDYLKNKSRTMQLSPKDEWRLNDANLGLLELKLGLFEKFAHKDPSRMLDNYGNPIFPQGVFNREIERIKNEITSTQIAVQLANTQINGMGSKAQSRVRKGIDRSMGRHSTLMIEENRETRDTRESTRERDEFLAIGARNAQAREVSQLRLRGGHRKVNSPSPSPSPDPETTQLEKDKEAFDDAVDSGEVIEIPLRGRKGASGFVVPFKADPVIYQQAYGVKARDVVDLFDTYHRQIDYPGTADVLLEIMEKYDPDVDLVAPLPDSIMRIANNRDWEGRTLDEILSSRAVGQKAGKGATQNVVWRTGLSHKQAFNLIKQGRPGNKPARKHAHINASRAAAVRPNGLLIEMFNAWRLSAAAEKAGLSDTDALQLFKYHRGHLVGEALQSVSREPSEFRASLNFESRSQLRTIGLLFGTRAHESPFNPEFWDKPMEDQLAYMKKHKNRTAFNPNNWIKVLEEAYHMDVTKELSIKKGTAGSYKTPARERLWRVVSSKMKQFMKVAGVDSAEAGDYLAQYAAGMDPSATPERSAARKRSKPRRDLSVHPDDDDESKASEAPKPSKKTKRRKRVSALSLPAFPKTGSYTQGPPGSHVYDAWDELLDTLGDQGDNPVIVSAKLENQIFTEFKKLRGRRLKNFNNVPSEFALYKNLKGGRNNADYDSFKVYLDKIAWNEYINGLGDWSGKKEKNLFDTNKPKFIYEQVFRPDDADEVSRMLQQWLGARLWNMNKSKDDPSKGTNLKAIIDEENATVADQYKIAVAFYKKHNKPFPVPNWKQRLYAGNQVDQLNDILDNIMNGKERLHAPLPTRGAGTLPERGRAGTPPERGRDVSAESESATPPATRAGGEIAQDPVNREKPGWIQNWGQAGGRDMQRRMAADVLSRSPEPSWVGDRRSRGRSSDGLVLEPLQSLHVETYEDVEFDPIQDIAQEEEKAIHEYYAQVRLPVRTHNNKLRAEVVHQYNYEILNGVHLLQTDNDVQPMMGTVHIVQPAEDFNDKHFMFDIEGDINEGHKVLVERSKRGPFRAESGRSTVMDRSAHVTYRKRAGAFEITIRRGVIASEMKQMLSKLSMHRMSVHGSHIVIIKGSKRFRLGPLGEINFKYLSDLVDECIQQYGSCGLEITERQAGRGSLYKGHTHGARFKSSARKGRGIASH